jgi:exopolyphosphatase/guanosine-5'-triphosphate,3'-diphosphate pyrophosphatase
VRLAAIDIGTNTVLLLVAEVDDRGRIHPLAEAQEIPRLGRDVDASGMIRGAAFPLLGGILGRYREVALSHGASRIAACATSAVRNAANRDDLVRYIGEKTGIGVEVIDGGMEAELTFRGALSGIAEWTGRSADAPDPAPPALAAVLDVGGGSTELCHGRATAAGPGLRRASVEIGSVRLTERYLRHSPPLPSEVARAREAVDRAFAAIADPPAGGSVLVAVAGTAVTLAGIRLGLRGFDRAKIEGFRLGTEDVRRLCGELLRMRPGEIRSLSDLAAGREDILAAGALILTAFAERFGFAEITVSTRGLRYGLVLREWEESGGGAGGS